MIYPQYASLVPNFLTDEEVDKLNNWFMMFSPVQDGRIGMSQEQTDPDAPEELAEGGNYNTKVRKSDIRWGDLHQVAEMHPEIIQKVMDGIYNEAVKMGMSYDIAMAENIQHTTYNAPDTNEEVAGFYKWHTDAGPYVYPNGMIRKLSAVIQLTDPEEYEGGNFQWLETQSLFDKIERGTNTIRIDDAIKTAPWSAKSKGSLIVFPSFVHHQVTPVTRGTRQSLVLWQQGYPHR